MVGFSLKTLLPRSLMGRSLLILVLPVVLVQLLTVVVFFDRHWVRSTERFSEAVVGEISFLAEHVEALGDDRASDFNVIASQAIRLMGMSVDYDRGAVLADPNSVDADMGWERLVADVFARGLDARLGRDYSLDMRFEEKWVFVNVQLDGGVMKVSFPQRRLFSSSGYIFLLWAFGVSVLLLLVSIIFMRNQVRPIRKLAVAAERFGRGRDVQFFKPQGAREVRQAGQAFQSMYKRIKRQIEQRMLMLAGVSHDLRTSLTRMRLQLSMMPDSEDKQAIDADILDMERMIAGYLDFVRDGGEEAEKSVDFVMFLEEIVQDYKRQAVEIDLDVSLPRGFMFTIRPVAMRRCIGNVIDNAVKYADKAVRLRAYCDDDMRVHLVIEDDGVGIDPAQYDDVFKPFYRTDTARSNAQGSVGLGLSIAMDIVHIHGGRIWLDRSDLGGLAVHMRLPL